MPRSNATAWALVALLLLPALPHASAHADRPAAAGPPEGVTRVTPAERRPLSRTEARAMVGMPARSADGRILGAVRDFTLGGTDNRVEAAVIGSGGILGFGARMFTVPVDTLHVDAPTGPTDLPSATPVGVTVERTARELEHAPRFSYGGDVRTLMGKR